MEPSIDSNQMRSVCLIYPTLYVPIDGLQLSGPGTCLGGLELFGLELGLVVLHMPR